MKRTFTILIAFTLAMLCGTASRAEVPQTINHQGLIQVNGQPFTGTGKFKFAIVDASGVNVWTNDGSNLVFNGVPNTFENVCVTNGVYSVNLGGTGGGTEQCPQTYSMTAIPPSTFNDADRRLRIWFDDGANAFQQLGPDHPLSSAPYSLAVSPRISQNVALANSDPKPNAQVYIGPTDPNEISLWVQNAAGLASGNSAVLLESTNHASESNVLKVVGDYDLDAGGPYVFQVSSNGIGSGTYGQYWGPSDVRMKKEVATIPHALERVLQLRGVNFRWKNPGMGESLRMGLIAQEVEGVFPEAVHTAQDREHTKSVEYQFLVGALVESTKAMNEKIGRLEAEVKALQDELRRSRP